MSGLFGDLDLNTVSEDILNTPDGTYSAIVEKITASRSTSKVDERGKPQAGITVTFMINDEDNEQHGQKVTHYQTVPQVPNGGEMTAAEKKNAAYLKRLLRNLGVPEERMNEVGSEELNGTEVYITTKKNGDFINVVNVKLQSEADESDVAFH